MKLEMKNKLAGYFNRSERTGTGVFFYVWFGKLVEFNGSYIPLLDILVLCNEFGYSCKVVEKVQPSGWFRRTILRKSVINHYYLEVTF